MVLLDGAPVTSLDEYVERGGGAGWRIAVDAGADRVLDELERSGLRGRGGAGFSTVTKWRSIVAGGEAAGAGFVVANGAEGEPGTFKDRTLLRHNLKRPGFDDCSDAISVSPSCFVTARGVRSQ